MPGTVANPVRLQNVFRRIVEVGWRTDRYIATKIDLFITLDTTGSLVTCSPAVYVDEHLAYDGQSLTRVEYEYATPSKLVYRNDAWVVESGISFSGMPNLPEDATFNYASWIYSAGSSIIGAANATVKFRYLPLSGADSLVPVPEDGVNFLLTTTVSAETLADIYIGSPSCVAQLNGATPGAPAPFGGNQAAQTNGTDPTGPITTNRFGSDSLANYSFPVSGLVATLNGRTYSPIGAQLVDVLDYNAGTPGVAPIPGQFYVLFERDPPSP